MKRVLATALVVLATGAAVVLAMGVGDGGGSGSGKHYSVMLDNAFGLIEGADVKVAGVRAGKISDLKLNRDDMRARVGIQIDKQGFGDLRTDVFCEARPQSLIGEYFLDCLPGTAPGRLPEGATIPVRQTGSTVPVDLVNDIMRRPYRERFSILLSELGAGLSARGDDLNQTIRRAVPALRETDKVLALLARQRKTIRDLYANADEVLGKLADRRRDVTRFVVEARDTASATAERARELRLQFQRLPGFLAELRPTMRLLGQSADAQAPALRNLNRSAPMLERFLDDLTPFAEASRPAFRTLAQAARRGRPAVKAARPNVRRLGRAAQALPEIGTNLALTLEHLDDPKFAVEKDPRSPRGGSGYTGLEALLRYVFFQSQATNLYDADGHLLKVSVFLDSLCANYADAEKAKDKALDRCAALLGPNRPAINQPDPTAGPATRKRSRADAKPKTERGPPSPASEAPATAPAPDAPKQAPAVPPVRLPEAIEQLLDDLLPGGSSDGPLPKLVPGLPGGSDLLDYLLGS